MKPEEWFKGNAYPGDPDWQGGQPMSKPTARELLDTIKKHEDFLNDLEWSREDDCLVFLLASRVEKVLALHVEWEPPIAETCRLSRCKHCTTAWPCPTIRILNGEEV